LNKKTRSFTTKSTWIQNKIPSKVLMYIALIIATIFFLIPIYVLVITSLKSFGEVNLNSMWNLPKSLSLESFSRAWFGDPTKGVQGLSGNFINSVILVIPATIISSFVGSINGYILTKWKFKGSNIIFILFIFGMFIPYQSILIPLVVVTQKLGLYGSILGLIVIHIIYGIPMTTLIFRNYYNGVPTELIESGTIDGAGIIAIYKDIIFPVSIPGFVVVLIWQFTSIWNEFLFATTITNSPSSHPITVALNNLAGSFVVEWNVQMAGALLAALPTLAVYILLQRYFIRGLLSGSVKG
jgi:glucose/mannose transport system permease protein